MWRHRDYVSGYSNGGRQVLSCPTCSFGGAQGVDDGAEVMFRDVQGGKRGRCSTPLVVSTGPEGGRLRRGHCSDYLRRVGRYCLTPFVVSIGSEDGRLRRDHVSGCSRGEM